MADPRSVSPGPAELQFPWQVGGKTLLLTPSLWVAETPLRSTSHALSCAVRPTPAPPAQPTLVLQQGTNWPTTPPQHQVFSVLMFRSPRWPKLCCALVQEQGQGPACMTGPVGATAQGPGGRGPVGLLDPALRTSVRLCSPAYLGRFQGTLRLFAQTQSPVLTVRLPWSPGCRSEGPTEILSSET